MEFVEPIRDTKTIEKMKKYLAANSRDLLLFVLGINSGLRVSDILNMKVKDVLDNKGKPKDFYQLREKKTGKYKKFILNNNIKKAVKEYLQEKGDYDLEDYLFTSRKGDNKPISRQQAWYILNQAAKKAGITDKIGTHTLRKTFGYHAYKLGTDITLLQQIFNHTSTRSTLRYIGITQDDIDNVYVNINL